MSTPSSNTLLFACSGASDVGGLTDQVARMLTREKAASMYCTAAVAAGVHTALERSASASRLVAIDGCSQCCARKILEHAGFGYCAHVELGALGLVKGESPINEETMALVARAVRREL
jgi:uncharacterized metal-binding protein